MNRSVIVLTTLGFVSIIVPACALQRSSAPRSGHAPPGQPAAESRPADNSRCLTCHAGFARESLSQSHLRHHTLCIDCHGPSTAHVQGAAAGVQADVLFGRSQVEPFCTSCHETPHRAPGRVAAWARDHRGQVRPNGWRIDSANICTDCHGEHALKPKREAVVKQVAASRQASIPLFNGRDLTGWIAEGNAAWRVENGMIVGTQGPGNAAGDLLTEASYRDFELTVTYRVVWPANSGVWFRYQGPGKTYQADILEYTKPVAYSGTIYCPGKLFLAINADKDLVNREGWNTLTVRAQGDHLQVWLNGSPVAEARDSTSDTGRIGFQIHPGKDFGPMKLVVRRIVLQPL